MLLADALRDLRERLRVELVRGLVHGVARDADGVADRDALLELLLVLGGDLTWSQHADLG